MATIDQRLISCNVTRIPNRKIEWIVIHYFGGLGDDTGVAAYFGRATTKASAHYALDGDSITQAVLDKDAAWHCGDSGRGLLKASCKNSNSIGIEVRPYKLNKKRILATDNDWYFDAATVENLLWLVKELMRIHNIPADHVIRHYDVTNKLCPRPWVGDDINAYYGKTGNQLWAEFKSRLEEDEIVDIKEIPVVLNGKPATVKGVNINGENFVNLRSLANADAQDNFTVDWDGKNIILTTKGV